MDEEASESCFCSETLDIPLGNDSGVLQHKWEQLHFAKSFYMLSLQEHDCHCQKVVPPIRPLFCIPEVCFRRLLVQLSAHLPPHFSLLAEPRLQLGSQVITGLGEGIWLTM